MKVVVQYDTCFNTTLVQLKVVEVSGHVVAKKSFNTTLVQLKDRRSLWPRRGEKEFQYHTGPIKSQRSYKDVGSLSPVSIPHWSN